MNFGQWFLLAMGFEYLVAAAVFYKAKNLGYAVAFLSYGVANFGLLWAAK